MADRKEVNKVVGIDFELERESPSLVYRTLKCRVCRHDTFFKITLADNGQWGIECDFCRDAAEMIPHLINSFF